MDLGIAQKAFVIVGGTTGMGFAAAKAMAAEGARLALVGRDSRRGQEKANALSREFGTDIFALSADGTKQGELEKAIDDAARHFGRLDGLAVTAGPMLRTAPFPELTDEDWTGYFENQLMVTVRACRAAIAHLIVGGGGTIVTTAAYSIRAQKPTLSAYSAMKSAISAVTKNIAKTFGEKGIRANCVCPGAIATEALDEARRAAVAEYGGDPDKALDRFMMEKWGMKLALNRVGRPHEVGELITFLLSNRAAYMTGALINIDGGTDF